MALIEQIPQTPSMADAIPQSEAGTPHQDHRLTMEFMLHQNTEGNWRLDPVLQHHVDRMKNPDQLDSYDWDHTITKNRPFLLPGSQKLDVAKYLDNKGESIELENVDLVILEGLVAGHAININTGKDANSWRWAMYMQERIDYIAGRLGMNDRYEDGRLKTMDGSKPVIFTWTVGNGGYSIDIMNGHTIVHRPIPLEGWEGLQRESELLRDSTKQERIQKIAHDETIIDIDLPDPDDTVMEPKQVTVASPLLPPRIPYDRTQDEYAMKVAKGEAVPHTDQLYHTKFTPIQEKDQLIREVAPELTPIEQDHRNRLQADIRDFAVHVAAISTKTNLVMDIDRIVNDKELNERWAKRTEELGERIVITDQKSLLRAFKVLAKDWNVNIAIAHAQGVTYFDISARGINKRTGARLVKNYVQGLYNTYGVDYKKVYTMAYGDNPGGAEDRDESANDAPMIKHTGGTTNYQGIERHKREGWPIYLKDIYGNFDEMHLTNLYLQDLILARVPDGERRTAREWLNGIIHELKEERKMRFSQNQ